MTVSADSRGRYCQENRNCPQGSRSSADEPRYRSRAGHALGGQSNAYRRLASDIVFGRGRLRRPFGDEHVVDACIPA